MLPALLELIISVDVESDYHADFDGLSSTQGGTELPGVERGQHFAGHNCRGGLEYTRSAQHAGAVEHAFDYQAGLGQT